MTSRPCAATGQTVPLIGLDLVADHPEGFSLPEDERPDTDRPRANPDQTDNVWVSHVSACKVGRYNSAPDQRRGRILTRFAACSRIQATAGGLILMDIATAQRALKRANRVDRMLLTVPATPSLEQWEQRLRAALPAGVELRRQGSETD